MGARTSLLAAGLALAGALASSAHAAPKPEPKPEPEPVEVARVGAETLEAGEEDGQVCVAIARRTSSSCVETAAGAVSAYGVDPKGLKLVGAAVPAAATRIEVHRAGVLLASAPTLAGDDYRGIGAGAVRFALVRLPDTTALEGVRVRGLDGSGAVVTVLAARDSELVSGRRRLLSGRSAGVRWSLTTSRQSELTPSVLDLAQETVSQCVRTNAQYGVVSNSMQTCASGSPRDALLDLFEQTESEVEDNCPGFRLLHGVVAGSVTRVSVLLGNGRSATVRTVAIGDGRRAYAVATGTAAVRAVRLVSTAGPVRVLHHGLAPLTVQCAGDQAAFDSGSTTSTSFDELPLVSPATPPAALAGPPAFRVADGPGGTLCLALGELPFRAGGCGTPSPWLAELTGALDSYAAPRAFVFAVPARVATVRISRPGGKDVHSIPTVAGGEYAGRYAGSVRFAAGSISGISALQRIELLDAAGAILFGGAELANALEIDLDGLRLGSPRRLAGRAGAPSLWRTPAQYFGRTLRCLALTDGSTPDRDDRCTFAGVTGVLLDASCTTRRLSVAVGARPGTRVLADVGARKPRRLRLRNQAGLLTLPAGRPLRAVTFIRKGRVRRVRINAPAASRQCGWRGSRDAEPS